MKIKSLLASVVCAAMACAPAIAADEFINITPYPKSITQGQGTYTLPQGLRVSTVPDALMQQEVAKFIADINAATPLQAAMANGSDANIVITPNTSIAPEGYNLTVTPTGIGIEASTATGLYFAFQTIKKVLPPNVMAGKPDASVTAYELPVMTVNDEPRFEYRGFMLDVCRHFFTVDEIKRMLDVMSYYKMNTFHWHLTEDQGWRMEVPSWPKLTTIGATAPNNRFTDYEAKTQYWINRPYGPYFYSIEEMKDVVAYAAERHITVVPEVEFPGHACAVVTAYPELSCNPQGAHSVKTDGGVYNDVLNVANPLTLQFAKDVIDVLAEVFPAEIIHIGGDECPTTLWQTNAECQAKVEELGFTGSNADQKYRKLQNWFTKQLADYAKSKGKVIGCWNEAITAGGADLDIMKESNATIWCWYPADNAVNVGVNNGLRVVYTPYHSTDGKQYDGTPSTGTKGSFYINRKQSPNDAPANGNSWDTVDKVYNTHPFTDNALASHPELCYGVQGTFWTERVSSADYLEWLALPRLIALAEVGWTPQEHKNFTSFINRVKADTRLLDLNGYRYSPYFLEDVIETPATPATPDMEPLTKGGHYVITNVTDGFEGITLADVEGNTNLNATTSPWNNNIWTVTDVTVNADKTHTLKLTNLATGRSIASADEFVRNHGRLIRMGSAATGITATPNPGAESFTLEIVKGSPFWPNTANALFEPECVTSGVLLDNDSEGVNFTRKAGADWKATAVEPVTFTCTDTEGHELFTGVRGLDPTAELAAQAPEIKNHTLRSATLSADGKSAACVYERTAVSVITRAVVEDGALLQISETTVAPSASVAVTAPDFGEFYTFVSSSAGSATTITATDDIEIEYVYSTETLSGVKAAGPAVSAIVPGKVYLIHDNNVSNGRDCFRYSTTARKVAGSRSIEGADPYFTWCFEETTGGNFAIRNMASGLYVQNVKNNAQGTLSTRARDYTLTYSAPAWTIKNATDNLAWDGQENLNMVGWAAPGHPHEIMEFFALPYFTVTVKMVDAEGKQLAADVTHMAEAGKAFALTIPERKGYEVASVSGNEGLGAVKAHTVVTISYAKEGDAINEIEAGANAPAAIYNLQGHRLQRITRPGIYVINGVKTLVR